METRLYWYSPVNQTLYCQHRDSRPGANVARWNVPIGIVERRRGEYISVRNGLEVIHTTQERAFRFLIDCVDYPGTVDPASVYIGNYLPSA